MKPRPATCAVTRLRLPLRSPSSSSSSSTVPMTTALIILPLAAALVVWLLPLPGCGSGCSPCSRRSPRSPSGRSCSAASTSTGPPASDRQSWFSDLGVSYHVGFYGFSLWLAGLTVVVCAAAIGYALLGRPRARSRLSRPAALPDGLDRRRLYRPGPSPLLRLLRGDADSDLRPDRRLGRSGARARDGDLRHLHDGRLAADARLDRRLRPLAGDVLARRLRHVGERVGLPRLPRRLRGQGADLPLPRLAASTPIASRRPRSPRSSRASSPRPPSTACCGS